MYYIFVQFEQFHLQLLIRSNIYIRSQEGIDNQWNNWQVFKPTSV